MSGVVHRIDAPGQFLNASPRAQLLRQPFRQRREAGDVGEKGGAGGAVGQGFASR